MIFKYLIESDINKIRTLDNKNQYLSLMSVCKKWYHVSSSDILWEIFIKAIFPTRSINNNYYKEILKFGKTMFKDKLYLSKIDENYLISFEIWNYKTGLCLSRCEGKFSMDSINLHTTNDLRIGILNNSSNKIILNPFEYTGDMIHSIEIRVIIYNNNKYALLYQSRESLKISSREVGGYFNLPLHTFFLSAKSFEYNTDISAYFCFDIVKVDKQKYIIHHRTNTDEKYLSSQTLILKSSNNDSYKKLFYDILYRD